MSDEVFGAIQIKHTLSNQLVIFMRVIFGATQIKHVRCSIKCLNEMLFIELLLLMGIQILVWLMKPCGCSGHLLRVNLRRTVRLFCVY